MKKAVLVLEDGTYFSGEHFGMEGEAFGEVIFHTAMTGYQEIATDPSNRGHMVCMTYPLFGNYGVNREDWESDLTHVSGFIVKELCLYHSNFRASGSIGDFSLDHRIVGIMGIDTRALTQHIRDAGSMMGVISTECGNIDILIKKIRLHQARERNWVAEVSIRTPWKTAGEGLRIAVLDLGVKRSILKSLEKRGCSVMVFPHDTPYQDMAAWFPSGILLSNGPGDPKSLQKIISCVRSIIASGLPVLGICLGYQLIALSMGMEIFKMKFGHHGYNHAVMDVLRNRCYVTAQNHSYAVSPVYVPPETGMTHVNIHDRTVEGLRLRELPVMGVQFHPEASSSFLDSSYIFDDFIRLAEKGAPYAKKC